MIPEDIEESKSKALSRSDSKTSSKYQKSQKEIEYRKYDIGLRDKLNLNKYTKIDSVFSSSGRHKESSFSKRFYGEATSSRFAQRGYTGFDYGNHQMYKIVKPEEPDKIMREINIDPNFEVDYVDLLTRYEFPAVFRLKKKFMNWFCKYMHQKIQLKKQELEDKKQYKEEQERRKKMREEEEADAKAKRDGVKVDIVQSKSNNSFAEVYDIEEIDYMEDNPTKVLQWAFWNRKGKRKLSGRLIPFRANQFIHINCALYTDRVFDDKEGHILNFYFAYKNARLTKCTLCGELGASVTCERVKCNNVYHFPCALRINCNIKPYTIYCPGCTKFYGLSPGYSDEKILDTRRRLYIVKHKELEKFPVKEDDLKIDTWRPFFYDSFNRVGNLTILSLCENVDALIKVLKYGSLSVHSSTKIYNSSLNNSSIKLQSYTSLRIYWKLINDPSQSSTKFIAKENICKDKSKAYYLCKGDNITVYEYPTSVSLVDNEYVDLLKKNTSETITQRLFGNNKLAKTNKKLANSMPTEDQEMVPDTLMLESNIFWECLVAYIKFFKPKFSFENIDFRYKTFSGEEKFPIQFWNTAKTDTKEKLLSSVESHWALAQTYDQVEKTAMPSDMFLENVIKINHGKEKLSSLFTHHKVNDRKFKRNHQQKLEGYDEIDIVPDQRNLPISMRYRRYRENPKKVLVGPSKIH